MSYVKDESYSYTPSNPAGFKPHPYFLPGWDKRYLGPPAYRHQPSAYKNALYDGNQSNLPQKYHAQFHGIGELFKNETFRNILIIAGAAFALWWLLKEK